MLFIIILLILSKTSVSGNVGSILFYNRNFRDCWSDVDLAKLRARRVFENLALPQTTPDKIDSKYIKETLRYFREALSFVEKDVDRNSAAILRDALADSIGAHMRCELLPTVRFAYYAGYIPFKSARQIHNYFKVLKGELNTQGLGWKEPEKHIQWSNLTVGRILISTGKFSDACSRLVSKRDSNSCIHLPVPKLDDEGEPSAIALPFKAGGLVSLSSPKSENILLKYYTTASRCILSRSPEKCRHSDFVNFNNELWHWMKKDVAPHLMDEKLYAAYGGVLRIAAAVQNYGKGLSRRNLYDYDDVAYTKWHPWRTLTQSNVYINADWSPQLYILLVILVVLAICLLQMCYGYLLGRPGGCDCTARRSFKSTKDIAHTTVGSVLSSHKRPSSKSECVGTLKTERVYDLNENTEKLMPVIMSDYECSEIASTTTSTIDSEEECVNNTVIEVDRVQAKRNRSPPKLETSMTQLKIDKRLTTDRNRLPMYSTSTITRSDTTYQDAPVSDTVWTGSASSTSGRSISTSSKSQTRMTRRSRDLAWARRVISKHSVRNQTQIVNLKDSFTTPP